MIKKTLNTFATAMLVIPFAGTALADEGHADKMIVVIETSKGNIAVELNHAAAPTTVDNFLAYAEADVYDGTIFHRVIPNFMIQGGGFDSELIKRETNDPIVNEFQPEYPNDRGTISMARLSSPDSATNQFFINLVDNANLNTPPGYAVFGKVVMGMDVVDGIASVPTGSKKSPEYGPPMQNVPLEAVLINDVRVIDEAGLEGLKAAEEAAAIAREEAEKAAALAKVEGYKAEVEPIVALFAEKFSLDVTNAYTTEQGIWVLDVTEGAGDPIEIGGSVPIYFSIYAPDAAVQQTNTEEQFGNYDNLPLNAGLSTSLTEVFTTMNLGGERWAVIPGEIVYDVQRPGVPTEAMILNLRPLTPEQAAEIDVTVAEKRDAFNAESRERALATLVELGYDAEGGTIDENGIWIKELESSDSGELVDAAAPQRYNMDITFWSDEGEVEFDSSERSGGYVPAPLTAIAGLPLALDGTNLGDRHLLVVPAEHAFGDRGSGRSIAPYTSVIFDVKLLTDEQVAELEAAQAAEIARIDEEQLQQAKEWLASEFEIDTEEGERLESGVWKFVTVDGAGAQPEAGESVTVHYTGWLVDGTQFDSSIDRGQPASFSLNQVVKGWQEGIPTMETNETAYFIIPSGLAYGANARPSIPKNSTLIFKVELLEISSGPVPRIQGAAGDRSIDASRTSAPAEDSTEASRGSQDQAESAEEDSEQTENSESEN